MCGWPRFCLYLPTNSRMHNRGGQNPRSYPSWWLWPAITSTYCSIVSGESNETCASNLKSTLVIAKLMARYLLTKETLGKDLKLITLEYHQWHLRTLDQNFVGVIRVYCVECCKDFGSMSHIYWHWTMLDAWQRWCGYIFNRPCLHSSRNDKYLIEWMRHNMICKEMKMNPIFSPTI